MQRNDGRKILNIIKWLCFYERRKLCVYSKGTANDNTQWPWIEPRCFSPWQTGVWWYTQWEVSMLNTQEPRTRPEMLSHNAQNGTMLLGIPWAYYAPFWININKLIHSELLNCFQNFNKPHIQLLTWYRVVTLSLGSCG